MKRIAVFSVLLLGSIILSACIGFTGADVNPTEEAIPNTGGQQAATTVFNNTVEPGQGGESPLNSATNQPGQGEGFENGIINEPTYPAVEDDDETAENYGPSYLATSQAFNVTSVPGAAGVSGTSIPATGGLATNQTPVAPAPSTVGTSIPATGGQGQGQSAIRLSQAMNFNLLDAGGQQLGRVVDLVIDLPVSRIGYLVVEVANQSRTLVRWSLVSERSGSEFVFNQASAPRFQAAPAFTFGSVDFADPNWDSDIRGYWQLGSSSRPSGSQSGQASAILASDLMNLQVRGSAIMGTGSQATSIPNTGAVVLGSVEDAVIIRQSGEVSYLLLSPNSSFLNLNNRLIPVPFAALTQQWNGSNLNLLINPNRLQNAPNLDATGLPDIFGSGWDQDFFRFWNDGTLNNPPSSATAQP